MLAPAHLAAALALLAALLWGAADFAGGFAARRASPLQVIFLAQGLDALLLLIAIFARHTPLPPPGVVAWGAAGGICNGIGLICLYTALAVAEMGLAAALSGIVTAALPAITGAYFEGAPTLRHLAGFFLAAVAIWRISRAPTYAGPRRQRQSLALAAVAGVGFGLFLVCSRQAARHEILFPLLVSRIAGAAVAALWMVCLHARSAASAATPALPATPASTFAFAWQPVAARLVLLAATAGLLDVGGNLSFMASTQFGRMDVSAVLASLYPAATIVLALVLLREKVTFGQLLGMAMALGAVALIAG